MTEDITLTFGPYRNKKLSEIPDRGYIEWLAHSTLHVQPEASEAARAFLEEHPAPPSTQANRSRQPGLAPRTYQEASKLGWMAAKGYGNARATMLAARDKEGFLVVVDEEDDEEHYRLLSVFDNGAIEEASTHFSSMSYAQVEAVLARYPSVEKEHYLLEAAEREEMEADEARRSLFLQSLDGKHTLVLRVWSKNSIDVIIDGRENGSYRLRELNERERRHPQWSKAAAILEPNSDDPFGHPGTRMIGLTPERKALLIQKIQEVTSVQEA
ncbi:hypothetical protein KSF_109800 [Reticulibacter mediterranei]|uniref:Uncharacterized protein n=1 Tax=Reticulibacter mediterranei TaxID=2778369 RepID=A0A8J3J229_9CHLR|nr:hypothetical protein [Reticulibacter mediterranei]GHP00933.1 hypothetical protein KSF_109800 [Reticulibacter mediterranei]